MYLSLDTMHELLIIYILYPGERETTWLGRSFQPETVLREVSVYGTKPTALPSGGETSIARN